MRILLINHHYYSTAQFTTYEKFFDPIPVMALGYLAGTLNEAGHDARILDDYIERLGIAGILDRIASLAPGMVGISCLTPLADEALLLAERIKERFPELPVVMGHRHADYFADSIVASGRADAVAHGEGERTLLELVEATAAGTDLATVRGITYRDGDRVVRTGDRPFVEDLDTIPFPAWDLFPLSSYKPCAEVMPGGKRHLPLLASRGCPYDCIFCSQEMGKTVRTRSPENVVREMVWDHEQFGVDGLILFDANFPMSREYAQGLCEEMIRAGLPSKVRWTTETRPDRIDRELLRLMKRAGCTKVQIGFEAGTDRILGVLNKRFTIAQADEAARMIREEGLGLYGLFVIGSPTETREEIDQTIRFAKRILPDFAKFNLFVPFPGTPAYENPKVRERIGSAPWMNYTSYPPTPDRVLYTPEGLEPAQAIAWQKRAFLRFYLQPRLIVRQLLQVRHISLEEYWHGMVFIVTSLLELTVYRWRRRRKRP